MARTAVDPRTGNPVGRLKPRALRSAADEAGCSPGDAVINAEQLEAGDILLFQATGSYNGVVEVQRWERLSLDAVPYSHCAIYLAQGRIVHAVPLPAMSRGLRSGILVDNVFAPSLRSRPIVALRAWEGLEPRQAAAIVAASYVHRGYDYWQAARLAARALWLATGDNRYVRILQRIFGGAIQIGGFSNFPAQEDEVEKVSQSQICSELIMSAYTVAFPQDNPAIPDGGARQWGALPGDFCDASDLQNVQLELAQL